MYSCDTICRLHTNLASGSCRKFFTCFLVEPHLPQAQTHIWTQRLEKISKPATHRDCESQSTFQIDHKSNAQRALCLTGCTIGSCGQKGSFFWAPLQFMSLQVSLANRDMTEKRSFECEQSPYLTIHLRNLMLEKTTQKIVMRGGKKTLL